MENPNNIESFKLSASDKMATMIRKKLKTFNILYFDGKLNTEGLIFRETTHPRIVLGVSRNKYSDLGFDLMVNQFYSDFKHLDTVIIHELIHVYQLQILGLSWEEIMSENSTGHGPSFMRKAIQLLIDHKIDTFDKIYALICEFSNEKSKDRK